MSSDAVTGYQSYLYVGTWDDAAASITTKVAEVVSISGPDLEGDDIEVTHMDSSDGYMEFLPGLVDGGEVSIELNFTKAETALLLTYFRVKKAYKVTFSDTSTWHFNGYIKTLGNEAPLKDKIGQTATFKVAGTPVFTAAA